MNQELTWQYLDTVTISQKGKYLEQSMIGAADKSKWLIKVIVCETLLNSIMI